LISPDITLLFLLNYVTVVAISDGIAFKGGTNYRCGIMKKMHFEHIHRCIAEKQSDKNIAIVTVVH